MLETWFDSDEKPQTEFKIRCSVLQKRTSVDANHTSSYPDVFSQKLRIIILNDRSRFVRHS